MRQGPILIVSQCFAVLLALIAAPLLAQTEDIAKARTLVARHAAGIATVQYQLKLDDGEEPGYRRRCSQVSESPSELIDQERPLEAPAYVLGPDLVVTDDPFLQDRFVESIKVKLGSAVVKATPVAYALRQHAVLLKLDQPLPQAKPLEFLQKPKEAKLLLQTVMQDAQWVHQVVPASFKTVVEPDGGTHLAASSGLVLTESGQCVGLVLSSELDSDGSWRGSPQQWKTISAEQRESQMEAVQKRASGHLLHATLHFRSPKAGKGSDSWSSRHRFMRGMSFHDFDSDGLVTELQALALAYEPQGLLILAPLAPTITAMLERIEVRLPDGSTAEAKFAGSLLNYGALLARTEKPLPAPARLATGSIRDFLRDPLLVAECQVAGDQRIARFGHTRILNLEYTHYSQLTPTLARSSSRNEGEEVSPFLYTTEGELLALPLTRRSRILDQRRWSSNERTLMPAQSLAALLADLKPNLDPANVPLSEKDENRLAWLGAVLQPLDRELAQANKVSKQTRDGEIGALVSYVYPNSPAAKAGIEAGHILLRLHVKGQPRPLEVRADQDAYNANFPWDHLDEMPEEYFDEIPRPWPSIDGAFTQTLTNLGIGTACVAELVTADGKAVRKPITIEESPRHFDSAASFKSKALGLTVRDITFEVRRYLQLKDEDPGVIVAKIESGSPAAVAGLKPFEIITEVEGQAVRSAADLEPLLKEGKELRLSVKRMAQARQVKLQPDAGDAAPAAGSRSPLRRPRTNTPPLPVPAEP